jgi:hypothetical protein
VNGRNPLVLVAGADWFVARGSKPDPPAGRVFELFGGVNGRYAPRLAFGVDEAGLPALRLTGLFISRPPWKPPVPAFGLCIEPAGFVLRANPDSPPFMRPPAEIAEMRFCCIVCRRLAVSCWNDSVCATLLCTDPKKRSEPPLRTVDGAAARPLAERLARDGTTGRLPAICRAPLNCSRVTATGLIPPAPKWFAFTVDMPRKMCSLWMLLMFENRVPSCSGPNPPKRPQPPTCGPKTPNRPR